MQIVPFSTHYQLVYTNFDFSSFSLISCPIRWCLWRLILSDWSDKSDRSDQSEEALAPHNRLANYSSSQPYNFATAALPSIKILVNGDRGMRSVEVADGDVDHGYPIGVMQAQVKGAIGGEAIAGRHGERTGYALESVLGMDGV